MSCTVARCAGTSLIKVNLFVCKQNNDVLTNRFGFIGDIL